MKDYYYNNFYSNKKKNIFDKSRKYEEMLSNFLKKESFHISESNLKGGAKFRPDFIVNKNGEEILIELKVTDITTEKTFYQILYYMSLYGVDSAYLALPKEAILNKNIMHKLLNGGIGIIRLSEGEVSFQEPKQDKALSKEDKKNINFYRDLEKNKIEIENTEKLKKLPLEFGLYVLIGGILVYSLSGILDHFLEQPLSFFIGIIIGIIGAISIILYYKKSRIKIFKIKK